MKILQHQQKPFADSKDDISESADNRNMSDPDNFVYDSEGNLTEDKSKRLKISYDWRGMPIEFKQTAMPQGSTDNELYKLEMKYDGSGRRISKTVWRKAVGAENWQKKQVTHYTGIGTEIRENYHNESLEKAKVVVNMPEGLGRYGIEDAEKPDFGGKTGDQLAGYIPNVKFEWYLKNHLGSTMLVYGSEGNATSAPFTLGTPLAAYDYRAFGEMVELTPPATGKVTENFTGSRFARRTQRTACKSIAEPKNLGAKRNEHDDEIALNYFGARYLDPMLGMWISVDPARQFSSPYLYAGNGVTPVNIIDPDGNKTAAMVGEDGTIWNLDFEFNEDYSFDFYMPDGSIETVLEPPHSSYLYSFNNDGRPNIIGAKVDFNMENNANEMIRNVNFYEPLEWYSNKKYDFKNQYYRNNVYTVGVFKGIAMTARDVGNALWAGYTKYTYFFNAAAIASGLAGPMAPIVWKMYSEMGPKAMNFISNTTAGGKEDNSSAVMQKWGYENYNPWW